MLLVFLIDIWMIAVRCFVIRDTIAEAVVSQKWVPFERHYPRRPDPKQEPHAFRTCITPLLVALVYLRRPDKLSIIFYVLGFNLSMLGDNQQV